MSNTLRGLLGGSLAVLLLAPLAAAPAEAADEQAAGAADLTEYVEVNVSGLPGSNTIASKLSLPLQLTPANVGAVTGLMIDEQDAVVLGDALRNVSSLNVQSGSGVHDYFVIRGFDSISSGLVLTDGAAEPEVSYYRLYNVEAIEVLKGPGGFLYGSNPLAGTVNIVRKQPLPGRFMDLGLSLGSYATYDGTLDYNVSGADGDLAFRVNGMWGESERYRDNKDSRHVAINPGLTWRPGPDSSLTLNLEYVDAEYSPDAGLPLVANAIPDVPRRRSYQSPGDFSEQTLNRFQLDYETRLSDRVTLRNKTYYRGLDWVSDGTLLVGTFTNPFATSQTLAARQLARLDDRQQFVGNQFEAILSLGRHRLLAGIELARHSDDYTFGLDPLDDIDVQTMEESAPFFPFAADSRGDVDTVVVAPYVVDQIKLSSRFELLAGLRYDSIETDGSIKSLFAPGGSPAQPFSRDDSELSPMLGALWAPNENLSLYANAGQSHAPPSTRLVDEPFPGAREPEQSDQVELGLKQRFAGGRVRTTFALYSIEREAIPIPDANGLTEQAGDQRSRGFEFELAAEPRPGLRTFFTYAYTDAELTRFAPCEPDGAGGCSVVDYSGNTPFMAPEHLASFWVSRTFSNGMGLAGGGRWTDEQFVDEDNRFTLDSSVVLDATLFYDVRAWRFKLSLKNLTDEEYEMRGISGPASVIPADPFSAYAGFEVRL